MKRTFFCLLGLLVLSLPGAAYSNSDGCGQFDPDCRKRLMRILSGIHVAPIEIEGGVRFGEGPVQGALRFGVELAALDVPVGDLGVLGFEAIYLPEAGGFRLRFTLIDSEVLFFCKDEEGKTHAPLAGLFQSCRPEGELGLGGSISQIQWDVATERVAARWAEVNVVFNFLRNGNGIDYLHKRLMAYFGTSLDTVFPGTTPGFDGAATMLRLNMGITGMIRSNNNKWEMRGFAGFRPNVVQWNDWAVEARMQIMHHLLFNEHMMGTIGLDSQYSYWTMPGRSIGAFASDRERNSFYTGLMFGLVF